MKKIILSATAALLMVTSANADILGAEAGFASWSSKLSGSIQGGNAGDTDINLEDNLGYGSNESNNFFWAYIDHPLPILPNLKIQRTSFSDSSSKTANVSFDGKAYSGSVNTQLQLDQIDIIGYYRILDNWVNLDLGVNFKVLDGNIKISDSTATLATNKDVSAIIPMLYGKARFDMPFTGLSVEADANYIGFSGSSFTDMKAGIVYETSYGLGVTAGYRIQNITIDDIDDTNSDMDIKGIYAGLFYHF